MPPEREGGGEQYGEPANALGDGGRDEEDPPRFSPPPPPLPGLAVVPVEFEEENKKKQKHEQAEVSFSEDVLIEILSRVPYRLLCRFKCVSRSWLALCSDRGVRKRSLQTFSGFFYLAVSWRFQNLSGKGPPMVDPDLPFLRITYKQIYVEQCSTSLLLCTCWKPPQPMQLWNSFSEGEPNQSFRRIEDNHIDYVVCNPATQEWTSLPPMEWENEADDRLSHFSLYEYILGFDPAVPSCFVVFAALISDHRLRIIMIYSSDTRRWTSVHGRHWDDLEIYWFSHPKCTFLNGSMHFFNYSSIVAVDTKGNAWRKITIPPAITNRDDEPSIGQSQGLLHAWLMDYKNGYQLSIWVLENYDSGIWTLKCTVNCLELFGRDSCKQGAYYYRMFAIHPDCDLIFLTDSKEKTLSYDMSNQEVVVISASGDFLGGLPYSPCFAEWKEDGH